MTDNNTLFEKFSNVMIKILKEQMVINDLENIPNYIIFHDGKNVMYDVCSPKNEDYEQRYWKGFEVISTFTQDEITDLIHDIKATGSDVTYFIKNYVFG